MIYYYYVTVFFVLINLLIFVSRFEDKKVDALCLLLNLLMLVSNLGYLAKAVAKTESEALLAIKISYVGGCFIPPLLLYTICCVSNIKVNKIIKTLSYGFSFFVYALVLTIGFSNIYYSSYRLSSFMGTTIVLRTTTPLYYLFYVVIIGNMLAELGLLIYAYKKKISISRKTLSIFLIIEATNVVFFFLSKLFSHMFEIMPLFYVIDGWLLLYLHQTILKYNIEDAIVNVMGSHGKNGYIVIDNNLNYLSSNDCIQKLIPEIENCRIDKKIEGIPLFDKIYAWIDQFKQNKEDTFSFGTDDNHYQIKLILYKTRKRKNHGYIIEMIEDTDRFKYLQQLQNLKHDLEDQVKEKTEHILDIQEKLILGMASMVENRDGNTGGHIRRTSVIVNILLNTIISNNLLDIKSDLIDDIIRAAPMHDLGKIGIDDKILRKPGRLTDEEYTIMKTHAEKSAVLVQDLLEDIEEDHFVKVATNIAKYHHERWDGSGYPCNLKGTEIPFEARIMAVADVYDALVSKRCYKEAMSFDEASKIMLESMGNHFDPKLKEVFLLSQKRLENYYYYEK